MRRRLHTHANLPSAQSGAIGSEIFVVLDERLFSRERTALSSQLHQPPALPATTHPPPLGLLPLEYENTLSLNKSLPQLQFISLFFLSSAGRWECLGMKWNYWSYQCKMAKLAQTKAICLYSPGKSESSLIIPWLELISGPCISFSPWESDTMYFRPLKTLNAYSNPWCGLLIDFPVRWGRRHPTRQRRTLNVEQHVEVRFMGRLSFGAVWFSHRKKRGKEVG